jgi:hypothetical protein
MEAENAKLVPISQGIKCLFLGRPKTPNCAEVHKQGAQHSCRRRPRVSFDGRALRAATAREGVFQVQTK